MAADRHADTDHGDSFPAKILGGGIYKSNSASNFQSICLLTWDASGGTTRKQARADLNIEKVTRNLTIYKKDQETQRNFKRCTVLVVVI